jgi:hypothetical protein
MRQSRTISIHNNGNVWDLRVTGEMKDPNEIDAKMIIHAAIEAAADNLIVKAEQEIAALKSSRSKASKAQRQALKEEIELLQCYKRRAHVPDVKVSVISKH